MSDRSRLRSSVSQSALMAGLAMALTAGFSTKTIAQQAGTGSAEAGTVMLPSISVLDVVPNPPNQLRRTVGVDRLPGTVQDTPQAITVVPQEVIQQQNATTLDQVLRNVPGVTVSIGEGGGGQNGDQFRLRGFEARGDIYEDGLRDFGVYTRDSFNYEQVQVIKGPSSQTFGNGTTGGAINVVTKAPTKVNSYGGAVSFGSGPLYRGVVDLNQKINENVGIRLNAMANYNKVVDRDNLRSERWGIAPSITFGLNSDTSYTVQYFHQEDDRVPDYGVPVILKPGNSVGKPSTEYGVSRKNWYGTYTDRDDTNVDMLTGRFRHKATDWLMIYNDTRVSWSTRTFAATPASCAAACITALFDGNPATVPQVARGGPGPYDQENYAIQNVLTGVGNFQTGFMRHEFVVGADVNFVDDDRRSYSYSPARPGTSLLDPNHSDAGYGIIRSTAATATRDSEATNLGIFVSDRMWFTPQFSFLGGLRFDRYYAETTTDGPTVTPTRVSSESNQLNPKASFIFEPAPNQNYYVTYSRSTSPQGLYVTSAPTPIAGNTSDLDPEENTLYEVGAKVSLLDNKLGLTGALFRVEKGNAKEVDPLTNTIVSSGDEQRTQGVELGVTGSPFPNWTINAAYTYLDSKTTDSTTAANKGQRVQFVPKHAASLWSTYEIAPRTPYNVTLGGGIIYRDKVFLNAANTAEAPSNISFDALISHTVQDKYRISLNGYNLTDRKNYDGLFGNRVIPSPGRAFTLTVAAQF